MADTDMGGLDSDTDSQGEQQSGTNNQDQAQPAAGNDDGQQSGDVSQNDQLDPATVAYNTHMQNRQRHDPDWWGTRQQEMPEIGDPNREFLFARNPPITTTEAMEAIAAYYNLATNGGTEPYDTLGVSMRPTTPPMDRARKQVEGLIEQGIDVTGNLKREIYEHFTRNSGLIAALQEHCRDKKEVPVEHVNEMIKMIHRLESLFAIEMDKDSKKFQKLNDDFDEYKKNQEKREQALRKQWQEAEGKFTDAMDKLDAKQSELDDLQRQGGVDPNQDSTNKVNEVRGENAVLRMKLQRLEKEQAQLQEDHGRLQNKVELYQQGASREQVEAAVVGGFNVNEEHAADMRAAEERVQAAEKERDQVRDFHQAFYQAVNEKLATWKAKSSDANDASEEDVSSDKRELLQSVTQDWSNLVNQFQRDWPPAQGAFEGGQIQQDRITMDALAKSQRELQKTHDWNQQSLQVIEEEERQARERLRSIQEQINDKEEKIKELHETNRKLEEETIEYQRVKRDKDEAESSSSRSSQRVHTDPPTDSDSDDPHTPDRRRAGEASSPASSPPEDIRLLRKQLTDLEDLVTEKETMVTEVTGRNDALVIQVNQLEEEKKDLEEQHEKNKARIEDLEVKQTELRNQNAVLATERDGSEDNLEKVKSEKEALEKLQATQKAEMDKLESDKKDLEKLQQENTNKIEDLEKEKKQLESKLAADQDELKKVLDKNTSLEEHGKNYPKELQDLQEEKKQLEADLAAERDNLEKARKDNETLTSSREDLEWKIARDEEQIKRLKDEITEMQQKQGGARRLERENEKLKRRCESAEQEQRMEFHSNYRLADELISAAGIIRKDGKPAENVSSTMAGEFPNMTLMDRINYLNLSIFLRTRNYIELALREGSNRLANMLIHDAKNWTEQCADDLGMMDPSVNLQVRASMYVLNGLKRIMSAEDIGEVQKGAKELKYGRTRLAGFERDAVTFGQLVVLADSLVSWMDKFNIQHERPENRRGLQCDKWSWMKNMDFVAMKRKKDLQRKVKGDPNMKAEVLRRTGLHSPLSPGKWDLGVGLDEPLSDDEVSS
ncbi:hypothetical protein ACHAPT_010153 [Fusarium lateritium]